LTSNITVLHTEASNGWGGQEIRILGEMLGMKGRGYRVILATPPDTGIYARASAAGIETVPVGMGRSGFVGGVFKLVRIIKANKVSVINTHSSRDSWMGSIAGRVAGAKVIRTRHISSALKTDVMTRFVYGPLCDGVITTGEFIKGQLVGDLGLAPDKIRSIPTGIDVDRFGSADGKVVRSELGIATDETIIGTAAALRSWKGHEFAVKAMPRVLEKFPGARLVLAGEGPMRPYIENWVDELGLGGKVFLLGLRDDVDKVIGAFDVSLLASYASEGIPQFVLQSMAAGKPVIGTRVGGIPEVVEDGVNGLLVPPKDPDAIADAVIGLLGEPAKVRRMGEAGRSMATARHTSDIMLDDIEKLYEEILGVRN